MIRTYTMKILLKLMVLALVAASFTLCKKSQVPEDESTPVSGETEGGENGGEPSVVKVQEIRILPQEEAVIELGKTLQLSVELSPENAEDKSVKWSSDREEIVSVSESGLVTAKAVGEASVFARSGDGNASASKKITVFKTTPEAFTRIVITNASNGVRLDGPGKQLQLKVRGEPEDALDEIEFFGVAATPAFTVSKDGLVTALAGCGHNGKIYYVYARSVKNPNVKSMQRPVFIEGNESQRAVLVSDMGAPFYQISRDNLRHSNYIGRGARQSFTISLEFRASDGTLYYRDAPFDIEAHDGEVQFTKTADKQLQAYAPSSATPSSVSKTNSSSLTINVGCSKRTVEFTVSELDPYEPKVGDGLCHTTGYFYDGGNRGNGIFENLDSQYGTLGAYDCASIIAWLGSTHLDEDMLYKQHCKGGLKVGSSSYHGIAIPRNCEYLSRSKNKGAGGEVFSEDDDDIFTSDALPSWFTKNIEDKRRLTYMQGYRMSAYINTAALVYRNGRNGSSHDVQPMNFFVDEELLAYSANESKKLTVSDFSWESDFYGSFYTDNKKNVYGGEGFSARCRNQYNPDFFGSTWICPSVSDLFLIFYDQRPPFSDLKADIGNWKLKYNVTQKIKALQNGLTSIGSPAYEYTYSYWTCQQAGDDKAPMFTITKNGSKYEAGVKYADKSSRAFVLPIIYF